LNLQQPAPKAQDGEKSGGKQARLEISGSRADEAGSEGFSIGCTDTMLSSPRAAEAAISAYLRALADELAMTVSPGGQA